LDRVRSRHDTTSFLEAVIHLTSGVRKTGGSSNPVWFLWEPELDSLLVYSTSTARRLAHIKARPRVSAHLNSDASGRDILILTGNAETATDAPAANTNPAYLAKYSTDIDRIGSTPERFGYHFSEALRLRIHHARGI
ncbi:pyridoxamine 5'-phosphate oxidase family protein, partial [Actinoplanes sp. NPDC051411]|uniref:pyridoxamine 5'-phosphate oxidase family protein n=1 Tax=Actinoplanes sp. NPDC051411 TaxID=3155522 RepID=UPI00342D8BF8